MENWATITVNPEVITWESSNDLCTFYRGQLENKSYEDLSAVSPVNYSEPPPIVPPAVIDVIPPTPTTAPLEPPPLCTRCSCDIQKQEASSSVPTTYQGTGSSLVSIDTISVVNVETISEKTDKTSDSKILSTPHVPLSSCTKSTDAVVETVQKITEQTIDKNKSLEEKTIVFVPSTVESTNLPINPPSHPIGGAATSTTQLHRSQLCSTVALTSLDSIVKQDGTDISSQTSQATKTLCRPSTPHKPTFNPLRQEQLSKHIQQSTENLSTPKKPAKIIASFGQKQAKPSSSPGVSVNTTSTQSNIGILVQAPPVAKIHTDHSNSKSPYPLKKHPLINIKAGSIVQIVEAPASLISSKSKVSISL